MSSERSYPHITRLVMEQPWAMMHDHFAAIRELVALRAQGEQFTDDEIRARIGNGPARRKPSQAGDVAVIPIYGALVPKADLMSKISGATAISDLRGAFMQAMADPDIGSIVFDVDSPGGAVDQVPEFAADIRSQRGRKPMLAVSNSLMGSGAYWLASQADEIAVSPSSITGSIGVFVAHQDISGAQEQDGFKTTMISAGKYKAEAHPFQPLTDEARAHIQGLVDSAYQTFTADVAKGRRVTVDAVRNGYGEGRAVDAKTAVKMGLADHVATLPQTISRAAGLAAQNNGQIAAAYAHELVSYGPVATSGNPATIIVDYTKTDREGARGDASFADEIDAVLCMADALVANGRALTAAKRDRLESLGERISQLCAVKEPSSPTLDLEVRVAAMRARARVQATKLRSVQ
jgi:signal peptide peptidase SppA